MYKRQKKREHGRRDELFFKYRFEQVVHAQGKEEEIDNLKTILTFIGKENIYFAQV